MALQAAALAGGAMALFPPQPPVAVQFSDALALANVDTILDYSMKQGVTIFNAGYVALPTKHNLGQEGLVVLVRD